MYSRSSDQHFDLRSSSASKDNTDFATYVNWLKSHSPFDFKEVDGLVSVSSGTVADKSANTDRAIGLGSAAAVAITGKSYGDLKLKRSDRVVSLAMSHNAVNVRGQEVDINPTLLFMRVTCVINDNSEMANYLEYEFSKHPPSLFEKGQMRKNSKSVFGQMLMKPAKPVEPQAIENAYGVLDGGYLLHYVQWSDATTFGEVFARYADYV